METKLLFSNELFGLFVFLEALSFGCLMWLIFVDSRGASESWKATRCLPPKLLEGDFERDFGELLYDLLAS